MTAKVGTTQRRYYGAPILLALLAFSSVGCDRVSEDDDKTREHDVKSLREVLQASWVPADAKERTQEVLKIYESGAREEKPIVILALLHEWATPTPYHYLRLWVFDQRKDRLGIGVKEEWSDPNGSRIVLEEQYPVCAQLPTETYQVVSVPAQIRSVGQRKDEKLWADWVAMDFDKLVEKTLPSGSPTQIYQLWKDMVPALWVSLPSEKGSVSVYVYDKAGHKSNAVNVLLRRHKDVPLSVGGIPVE
jgi:hypothetical protein